ncbi:MAG TPA: hypothetical protein DEG69_03420 [Flavobacteriaceae bacterium]|nr:hypothetical protein [Flavobacteriaceae bacterium]
MNEITKVKGRPPKFNASRNAVKRILEALAKGQSIRRAIKEEDISWNTFRKWMFEKPELREAYEQAKSDGIHYTLDSVEDQCKDMIKSANDKTANLNSIKALDILVRHKQFLASKLSPKTFGTDKQQLSLTNAKGEKFSIEWSK